MSGGLFETEDDTDIIDNTSGGLFANGEVGDAIASFEVAAEAAKNAAVAAQTAAETAETNAETAETNAATSATAAAGSATSAAASVTTATTQASTATTKASEAATSASTATTQASTATTKASEASTSATNAVSSATSAAASATTATTKASEASASATTAATQATNAASSATGAANSASTASTHKTAAETAKAAAETAKAAAETAKAAAETAETNAETAETNAETAETNASTSATNAAASATSASGSASTATTQASAASTSASTAATQASTATTKASEASTSATSASNSATAAASSATAANTHKTAAETAKTAAETAKTAAETAETNAETAETNAETAETNAAASSSSASTSATNAAASATSASGSASTATTQASTATTKASEASTSATNAASSATAAANSATAAASSATSASSSATTATTQASTATTKANTATTKASEASTSAASALSAKAAAESARDSALSAFDNFDDKYLGAKSSDPTVDNDGDALVSGALYFNTTNDEMKVYTGSAWVAAYASLSGALLVANNLSDVNSAGTAATNIGLGTGSSPTFAGATINGNISVTGTVDGRDVAADGTKLDGVEANATADQTAAEIRALVESATDSNVFTDNDHTKLNSIESNATADQTDAEIRAAVEAATDSNVFTDADHAKLNGIATSANNYSHPNHSGEVTSSGDGATIIADNVVDEANLKVSNAPTNGYVLTARSGNTGGLTWEATASTGISNLVEDTTPQLGGNLDLNGNGITSSNQVSIAETSGNGVFIRSNNQGVIHAYGGSGGGVYLRHNNDTKFKVEGGNVTTDGGADFTFEGASYNAVWDASDNALEFADNAKAKFGTGGDLEIYHHGGSAFIDDVGDGSLSLRSNGFGVNIMTEASAFMGQFSRGGAVTLYHNGNAKIATTSTGVDVTGNIVVSGTVDGRDLATDGTKLDGIASSANNYVHPNHSGEVTSTADGATVIADNVVDEANLKVSNSPTNGYVLTAQSGNTGGLTWADAGGVSSIDDLSDAEWDGSNLSIGTNSFSSGTSHYRNVAIGWNTGNSSITTGDDNVLIGRNTGSFVTTGTANTAVGQNALQSSNADKLTGSDNVGIGQTAGSAVTSGSSNTFVGSNANGTGTINYQTALGYNAKTAGAGATAINNSYASGADSFAANITNSTSSYGATGANSIAMGELAKSTNTDSVAIGPGASATGSESMALHKGSLASGLWSTALGYGAYATATNSIALGTSAYAYGAGGAALGRNARSYGEYAVGLANSYATNSNSLAGAIGTNSSSYGAKHDYGVAFGYQAVTTADKQIALGSNTAQVKVSGAYTLPTADGSANYVLTTNGSGAASWAEAASGADLYAANESSPSAQPSATGGNAVAIGEAPTASGNDSFAVQGGTASGNGALAIGRNVGGGNVSLSRANSTVAIMGSTTTNNHYSTAIGLNSSAHLATVGGSGMGAMALGGSYASGADSFAAAIGTNSSSYGARSANAIAIGQNAYTGTSSTASVAIGRWAYAEGGYSLALGNGSHSSGTNSTTIGYMAKATAQFSFGMGYESKARIDGMKAYASGKFSSDGDAQSGTYVLRSDTTDATAEALTTNNSTAGSGNQIILQNESAMTFTGTVVVREDASDGDDYAGWEIKGVIMRQGQASDTALGVGIVNDLYHTSGLANAAVALSADTTNGGLKIQVTGIASTNLNWVATVHTSEVVNA